MNSINKGKRFEREIAKQISKAFGIDCKRTPCSGGMSFKGDIISLSGMAARFHWECKNQEKLNIWKANDQARRDCQTPKIPVVVYTKNNEINYVSLEFEDFINLLLELKEVVK